MDVGSDVVSQSRHESPSRVVLGEVLLSSLCDDVLCEGMRESVPRKRDVEIQR